MKNFFSSIIASLCVLLMASCGANTPSSVAEDYLDNIKDGKYLDAIELMKFKKEPTQQDKEQLAQMFSDKIDKTVDKYGEFENYEIVGEEISEDGQFATVYYKMNYANKKNIDDKVKLILVDGQWKVNSGK